MEWTPLEPGDRAHKYYCADVGLVLELAPKGGDAAERVDNDSAGTVEPDRHTCLADYRGPGQENPAHNDDPHETDGRRDEPRVHAVRCPESIALPRDGTQQNKEEGATPAEKSAFEISPARQRPNGPDIISIARGNEVRTRGPG